MSNNYEYFDIVYPFIHPDMKALKGGIKNVQLYAFKYPDGIEGTPIGLFLTDITVSDIIKLIFEVRFSDGTTELEVVIDNEGPSFTTTTSWCKLTVMATPFEFKESVTITDHNMIEPCCCIWNIKMSSIFTAVDSEDNPVLIDPNIIGDNWSVTYNNGTIVVNGLLPSDAAAEDIDLGIVSINGLTAESISIKTSNSLSLITGRSTITIEAPQNE